ncbi:MAG: DinB family protein [Calditrichia bacterium]
MELKEAFLQEFDQEMAKTRKMLKRVPDDKLEWKPRETMWSLGQLATHLANLPVWIASTISRESLDMHPEGEEPARVAPAKSRQEILDRFDENVRENRKSLEGAGEPHLMNSWSLLSGGKTLFTLPRLAVLRSFVLNHIIHHRGQLGVYLRMNDVAVPGMFGPSADEEKARDQQ